MQTHTPSRFSCVKRIITNFRKNISGFGAVEAALVLPLFLGLTMAVIDYGLLMTTRGQAVGAVNNVASAIQNKPSMTAEELQAVITSAETSAVKFSGSNACVCTKLFELAQNAEAQSYAKTLSCDGCNRDTAPADGTPRLLAIRAITSYKFITPVGGLLNISTGTDGSNVKFLQLGRVITLGGAGSPPIDCSKSGQALQFDSALNKYKCVSVLNNLEVIKVESEKICAGSNNNIVAQCPAGYGLLGCAGSEGDLDEHGEKFGIRLDYDNKRCVAYVSNSKGYTSMGGYRTDMAAYNNAVNSYCAGNPANDWCCANRPSAACLPRVPRVYTAGETPPDYSCDDSGYCNYSRSGGGDSGDPITYTEILTSPTPPISEGDYQVPNDETFCAFATASCYKINAGETAP